MKNVYFIGIGGIGMSAIARFYKSRGANVSGYDKTPSKLTEALVSEGIDVHYDERCDLIPGDIENTLVIYTPAIPADMAELVYVREHGYRLIKRSRALGEIAKGQRCLAVAGTHGKTTTSTLLAHILTSSGAGCNAFLGGISKNYHSNLLLSQNHVLVAEADEFDRSFLQLYPEMAAVTAADADHLDIYFNLENVRKAFHDFISQTEKAVVIKKSIINPEELTADTKARVYTYSFNEKADFYASDLVYREDGCLDFTFNTPDGCIRNCRVGVPGWVNVENAIAAGSLAYLYGVSGEELRKALLSFSGVERRFDVRINRRDLIYIDDYAHHPKEIEAALNSIIRMFPGKRICAVFQPHLYTRTRDFYMEFARSLDKVSKVILLPIYPAREEPIEGVCSEMILKEMTLPDKAVMDKEEALEEIRKKDYDILITLGAGNIDRLVPVITEMMK